MLQSLYLLRMHNPEGYADNVTINPYGPYYYYYHKDHLGNNREVWRAAYSINGTVTPASIIQQTSYYPSGLPWSDGTGVSIQPYKYNGKEFVEMHGLDTYDYGARGYYPASGRFMTVDPLAEKKPWMSPYAYCSGDPVNRIDPDGKNDKNGQKTEINPTNGVPISAQSTTGGNEPRVIRSTAIKQLTPIEQAMKTAQSQPRGEIKSTGTAQEKYVKAYNELPEIIQQAVTNPVFNATAAGGVIVTAGVLTGVAATSVSVDITPLIYKSAQIAIENPHMTQSVVGVGIGLTVSAISGQMQDVPSFTTGLPWVDNASQITQTVMTSVDFFKSIAPQTNVQPVNNKP